MYHSIKFGDMNTWDDWHLIPETQPIVAPPAQKTNYIDIPGASGSLDMSEVLTGYPIFSDRTGSFTFIITNYNAAYVPYENHKSISKVVEDIAEYLHGRRMKMILEDDPNYYYMGRFTVSDPSPEEDFSRVTINYTLEPYKWSLYGSVDTNWIWDPFSFVDGLILKGLFADIPVVNNATITIPKSLQGTAPIQPLFTMMKYDSSNRWSVTVTYNEKMYESGLLSLSSHTLYDFVMTGTSDAVINVYCSGSGGKVSVNFRAGRM